MNKNDLINYIIGIVILFIIGFFGDKFIKVIILLMTSIISVMESNFLSIKRNGILKMSKK